MVTPATAIVGLGMTELSPRSGRSELRLALEAVTEALRDAGIAPAEVDGLVTFALDSNNEEAVARNLGLDAVTFFARTSYGGAGACAAIALASMAVATGHASTVVCYRAANERSGRRFGQPNGRAGEAPPSPDSMTIDRSWTSPFGVVTPAASVALAARRYMHQYGATSEDFGNVAVVQRQYAASNPRAHFREPITLADHQRAPMVADPIRLLDCCLESDGAVALVVTGLDRARDLSQRPAVVLASAMGFGADHHGFSSPYSGDIAQATETKVVGDQLWARSGLTPQDVDVANLYDHFTPGVLMQLEALGFCAPGEAPELVRTGGTGPGGVIPTNTNGGQLNEGYVHGMNGVAEAVRQIRGTSVNQISGAHRAIVTSAPSGPTSGLLLGRDR